jgi:predicted dehydrogenase
MTASNSLSRRAFLQSTGIIGAGLVLAPTILAQDKPPPSDDLNVALIGAGTQGRFLLEQALRLKGIRFTAVCDIWPFAQDAAAKYIAARRTDKALPPVYVDYQDMLAKEKDLQATVVATPDWMHADHSIACMKAGLDVYCEKEMSNDILKARQMVLASRETKRLLQIGHQRRSHPRYLLCYDNIIKADKLLGRITYVFGQWNRSVTKTGPRGFPKDKALGEAVLKTYGYDNMDQFRDWRWFKKFGGGPIADLGSHQIDIFGWFLGAQPRCVAAFGGLDYWKDQGWDLPDNVTAIYEFDTPQGVVRALYQTLSTTAARGYFESFMGTDGTLQMSENPTQCRVFAEGHLTPAKTTDPHPWAGKKYLLRLESPDNKPEPNEATKTTADAILEVYKSKPPVAFVPTLADPTLDQNLHLPHLANFFDTVRGKAKLNCPGEVGYETAVQVLKVNEAIAAGKTLTFKPEDFKV